MRLQANVTNLGTLNWARQQVAHQYPHLRCSRPLSGPTGTIIATCWQVKCILQCIAAPRCHPRYYYNVGCSRMDVHVKKGLADGLFISAVGCSAELWALIMDAGTDGQLVAGPSSMCPNWSH